MLPQRSTHGPSGVPTEKGPLPGTSKSKGPFGPATSSNLSEIDPEELGSCGPNSVKFRYAAYTSVERYQNGDLIFSGLDPDPDNPSTGCFNIIDGTGTVTMNFVILGGTGRFEGATGWGTATGTGSIPLAWELVPSFRITHSAFWGSAEGEIFLAND